MVVPPSGNFKEFLPGQAKEFSPMNNRKKVDIN